eukprot:m.239169 g.239169  ORF g.239169 m.239169 type:complete len:85 (+) comp19404_c0_seq19:145-399(+)
MATGAGLPVNFGTAKPTTQPVNAIIASAVIGVAYGFYLGWKSAANFYSVNMGAREQAWKTARHHVAIGAVVTVGTIVALKSLHK